MNPKEKADKAFEAIQETQAMNKRFREMGISASSRPAMKDENDILVMKAGIDALICGWSRMMGHSFTEQELDSLVDMISDWMVRREG